MNYFTDYKKIALRKMRDHLDDYKLMTKWLSDPEVLKYYEGRDKAFTLEKAVEKYRARILGQSPVVPCIMEYNKTPIGYIQYYIIDPEEYEIQDLKTIAPYKKPYGIDLFIGETDYWNKGIGTDLIKSMIDYLFKNKNADAIFIDPQITNIRAIRSYEKCGFKAITKLEKRELHEGEYRDNLLMVILPQ